ncbi:NAD(+) synthase [Maribacter polysiphoniae]|uniref:NH(3)-dependent NAD(+) synthetase n=1 Tax=Maribacter polysiphoniae TaxID=429344 RepID=A0A316E0G8_9FLAO|nr:NAD(+) synthase [Maribacter polysiphoniae]MBD1260918.1 NAD(+) synthase [Maribacter polysiphoniae]PWK23944.1 NAD+ synthase [Maribacter polysiphoniae]
MNPKHRKPFSKDILHIENIEEVCNNITEKLRNDVVFKLQRRGAVIGISGGIDSSVCMALSAKAFGPSKVTAIMLPEQDSSEDSKNLALKLADTFNVKILEENITHALDGFGCYQRRDEAIRRVITDFDPNIDKAKIEIRQNIDQNIPAIFSITVIKPDGKTISKLLPAKEYLQIVAATNFKQRSRMSMLYYHAERLHYAVIGTPNKHEVEQGFFVKYGDGGADVMPIGHLYKTQVYQLASHLGVPQEIIDRTPTTDTYTAEQTQEDFFYQMPFESMDLIWYGWENGYSANEVGKVMDKTEQKIHNIYKSFERKKKTTEYLRMRPIF